MLCFTSRFIVRSVGVFITVVGLNLVACGDSSSDMTMGGSGGILGTGGTPVTSGGVESSGGVVASGGATATGGSGAIFDARPLDQGTRDTNNLVSFNKQILPLLEANCVRCHGPTRQNNGVRVDSYIEVKSRLPIVTEMLVDGHMPPSGPLPLANRQLFQAWVDEGALND